VPPPEAQGCPLPIVPLGKTHLSAAEVARILSLAGRLLRDEPALAATEAFGSRVRPGLVSGPSLFYEDHSEIRLVREWTAEAYKYRIALLAGDGDLLAVLAPRELSFEAYLRDILALGNIDIIAVMPDTGGPAVPMVRKLPDDEAAMSAIVSRARGAGSLNIVPYICSGGTWRFAAEIAAQSGANIRVAAPPPRLARRINDKIWFAHQVEELLGRRALPPTKPAFGPTALAGCVARLARTNAQVVIKVPDSAGSIGNIVLAAETIRGLDISGVRDLLLSLLDTIGWRQTFPLMVAVWEAPVIMSPSVQAWIPEKRNGPPVIEGIFAQMIIDGDGKFVGAERVEPAPPWGEQLAHEALMLATLFQELGYFGRCSFDALLVGAAGADVSLHWVECNGRWGAVSIPMTLANRLVGDWKRAPFIVIQHYNDVSPKHGFDELLKLLDPLLFRPGAEAGVVVLTPGVALTGKGFDFLVIERDPTAARAMARNVARVLDATGAGRT